VIRFLDSSFASQDPDEVGCFRQQDLKEAACASSRESRSCFLVRCVPPDILCWEMRWCRFQTGAADMVVVCVLR
jgi:hypothetical protein